MITVGTVPINSIFCCYSNRNNIYKQYFLLLQHRILLCYFVVSIQQWITMKLRKSTPYCGYNFGRHFALLDQCRAPIEP
jgi:hypothetical protein